MHKPLIKFGHQLIATELYAIHPLYALFKDVSASAPVIQEAVKAKAVKNVIEYESIMDLPKKYRLEMTEQESDTIQGFI